MFRTIAIGVKTMATVERDQGSPLNMAKTAGFPGKEQNDKESMGQY